MLGKVARGEADEATWSEAACNEASEVACSEVTSFKICAKIDRHDSQDGDNIYSECMFKNATMI